MTTLREAAQQFVSDYENGDLGDLKHYARAIRAALAQQEPTVRIKCTVVDNQNPNGVPFEQWVNAPRREWQGLTEDEIRMAYGKDLKYRDGDYERFARAVEAKLKEKNNG